MVLLADYIAAILSQNAEKYNVCICMKVIMQTEDAISTAKKLTKQFITESV